MDKCIFLGLPGYGLCHGASVIAATLQASKRGLTRDLKPPQHSSLLAKGFNDLWCTALQNRRYTHFAMLHSDIIPEEGWLDVLMDELERTGADLVSAVSPIKDDRGLTSCGIGNPMSTWWSPKKRFTMKEIMALPETFTAADAGYPGDPLLVNTGCWLADLRNPKWMEKDEDGFLKVFFTIKDGVRVDTDGRLRPVVQSEDWFFSCMMHMVGLKALNTRKVRLKHIGERAYSNDEVWGQDVDTDTAPFWQVTNA